MHLQQTKKESRKTGGPQYYFHNLTGAVKAYLRQEGVVPVALVTPYGATKSNYVAVSKDRKTDARMRPIPGHVGHDRIQQGAATESIGESIRKWYRLPTGDFETVAVDIDIRDDVFYLTPLRYKLSRRPKAREIRRIDRPLTLTNEYTSPLWLDQLRHAEKQRSGIVNWALEEICRIVRDHKPPDKLPHIQEPDILRASGPLKHLGIVLGGYVGKGYDCMSEFRFRDYPPYRVPVEIKRNSAGFEYQQKKYGKDLLTRAVVLCAVHGHRQVPPNIDIIELDALCQQRTRPEVQDHTG